MLLRRHVTESPLRPGGKTDLAGLFLGVAALGGLTAGFITAGQLGWLSPLPAALLAAGVAPGVLLVVTERRQRALICLSLYLQQARGEPALSTGLLILPMSAAVGAGSYASGRLTARLGSRPPLLAGLTLAAAGAVVLAWTGTGGPLWVLITGSVLLGLCSLAMPAMTAVAVGSAGPEHAGVASGILNAAGLP